MAKKQRKVMVPGERGVKIIHNPVFNKGTSFTETERLRLGLHGLLPPRILSQDLQTDRIIENFRKKPDDLEKYIYLVALQDRNEHLFYYVVRRHLEEVMPIIYTPTVGKACQSYGHIFRRSRGLYISIEDRGHIKEMLLNWPHKNARIIVVTDGERILGLGDLGVNGMGIPIGKLALYTACAGIDPTDCLPIMIDVGTNNESLLRDPLYLGHPHHRITGESYLALMDEFVEAVQDVFPNAIIQLEDFATHNAFLLLNRYKDRARIFNDDIQGTAGIALAGLLSSLRISGLRLEDQKILYLGAGEAGVGIGNIITSALQSVGLTYEEAKLRSWFFDSTSLICKSRKDLAPHKLQFAHDHPPIDNFVEAVKILRPTAIIGVCGQPGKFNEEVIRVMSDINDRPVIFALSNPTSKSECSAEEVYTYSRGRAIFASGSPFPPVELNGKKYYPGQGNNVYIFPGIGLGINFTEAKHITDRMFFEAAKVVSEEVTDEELEKGTIYPSFLRIRRVSLNIALAVTRLCVEDGLVPAHIMLNAEEDIESGMYVPDYPNYL